MSKIVKPVGLSLSLFLVCAQPLKAGAHIDPQRVCDVAANLAAEQTNVPLSVLLAITRVETGRSKKGNLFPWPWTANVKGKGFWFSDKFDAITFLENTKDKGIESFDIGCFQLNYRWHKAAFSSLEQMIDPAANAQYAAEFLSALRDETGSWNKAAGFFHSRTPALAKKYRAKFELTLKKVSDVKLPPLREKPVEYVNTFPLLLSGSKPSKHGSLVPRDQIHVRPLFEVGG